jgi:hypothetical protein
MPRLMNINLEVMDKEYVQKARAFLYSKLVIG